jgi:uncharacterized membrane protein YqjE
MAVTRTAPRQDLATTEVTGPARQGEDSVAELAKRLAHESVALADVELRRLGAAVRERQREAARVVAAGSLAAALAVVAVGTLAVAGVLYLGRMWQDYAAGALVTAVLLLILAGAAATAVVRGIRQITRAEHEPIRRALMARQSVERSPSDGT